MTDRSEDFEGAVLALSGGIGGAKLALGLAQIVAGENLLVAANTGDDFCHLGLEISPDIDTLLYTLAGLNNEELGWGRRDETWNFMAALDALGGPTWFRLGDGDLATHVERTRRLLAGQSLADITDDMRRRLGIAAKILPMCDAPVRTKVLTDEGWLDFQKYFVGRRCAPVVKRLVFEGAEQATPNATLMAALRAEKLRAVVICPSNPFISIEPILALPGVRAALADCAAPVVAVSPIIGGRAVKGPTAKIMGELGLPTSSAAATSRYHGFLDAVVIDEADAASADDHGVPAVVARTLMLTLDDRIRLAEKVLHVADQVRARS